MNKQLQNLMYFLIKRTDNTFIYEDNGTCYWISGFAENGYACLLCDHKFLPMTQFTHSVQDVNDILDEHALGHAKEHNLLAML